MINMDDLHFYYEEFRGTGAMSLGFTEFALLYLVRQGVPNSEIHMNLYTSQSTISRCKARISKRFGVKTFEQALFQIGSLGIFDGLEKKLKKPEKF